MTFKELQDALSDWLAMNEKRLPPSSRKQLINLALVEIQRKALWRYCLNTTSIVLSAASNSALYPQDLIEVESLTYQHPILNEPYFVEFLPPGEFNARYKFVQATEYPTRYTIAGQSLLFNAKTPAQITMSFTYYRLLPELVNDNDSNPFTAVAWDAVLFSALELASVFGIEDARVPLFAQKKEEALQKLLVADGRLGTRSYRPKSRIPDDSSV